VKISLLKLCAFSLLASLLSGCAHSYVDQHGNRHIVGLVSVTLPPVPDNGTADWVRLRTVGLAINRGSFISSLDLGYSDSTLAVIRNNSCAFINREPWLKTTSTGGPNAETFASH
jgi:hypothetical protein